MDIASMRGQTDLYAALARLAAANPGISLADVMAGLVGTPEGERLASVNPHVLARIVAHAQGAEGGRALTDWLGQTPVAPMFRPGLDQAPGIALLTNGQRPDMPAFSDRAFDPWFVATGATYGLGAYGEKRNVYASDQFADAASPERRTIHLGVDVFAPVMTPVHAPLDGVVATVAYNADPLDYGHTLFVEHEGPGGPFWTLYGHLAGSLTALCQPGQRIKAGQHIADMGDWHENGGWASHLHFQIITDRLVTRDNFYGVGHESLWPIWKQISPDPNLILRLPKQAFQV
jgi:murein DD-endopeptidase MepM/ murein hydrolase activator NlpD